MPSMNQQDIAAAHSLGQANIDIKDNAALSANPEGHKGYVYFAKLDKTSGLAFSDLERTEEVLRELNSWDVVIAPRTRAVVFNELAIDWQLHNHQTAQGVEYYTVNEIVTGKTTPQEGNSEPRPLTNLPTDARLIRVMTPFIVQQHDKTYVALTRRGKGATHEGFWGCSSKLLGQPLTTEFVKAVANSELLITVDGNPALNAELQLPKIPHTISFHGGHANTTIECAAFDNPEERTLTLIFPMMARLPQGKLEIQNIEHPNDKAEFVELSNLYKEGHPLMAGLKQYLLGE